ncbi:SDR family oxidoreductase [Aurantivibrio plasticivorans]
MQRLYNKTILITGAAQGIGASCAEQCIEHGAYVFISDIDSKKGTDLATTMRGQCEFIPLDVTSVEQWQEVDNYFRLNNICIDGLINNAGITGFIETNGPHDPEHLNLDSWHSVMETNLLGTVLGCKYGIKWLKANGGNIINISSRSGLVGIPGAAAYAASKAAIRNHTKTVALYCAQQRYDIRCNSIHPAAIYTSMWDSMLGEGKQRESAIKQICADIPLGVMGEPNDVAHAAIYLLSDESKYITGTELNIDGGILAGSAATPA